VDDAQCLRAWAAGDAGAGELLFERHFEAVARFFRNKTDADHDDLIQATFLGCLESLPRFRAEASFRTYIFAVARNVLSKYYRSRRRERERLDFGTISAADLGASPSAWVAQGEGARTMLQALRRIPMDSQIALELHYWEGMTGQQIAEVLDIPLGTAKTRLRRARQLLEAELEKFSEGALVPAHTYSDLDAWARGLRDQLF
jgi:RNA polymerase sigma-70 factor (ECF subfamily)